LDLTYANGCFGRNIEIQAIRGSETLIEMWATDTEPESSGGPNSALVDWTTIVVPSSMSR
jgi:hypothetical protein